MGSKLALDIGTAMGWCRAGKSGTLQYRPKKSHGYGMRFLQFREFLNEQHAADPITEIHYEYVRNHAGILAAHVYGGFQTVLWMWAEENLVDVVKVSVQEAKKTWTGAGNASKKMMVAEAKRRGFDPQTEDEADAIAIWHSKA